MDTRWEFCPAVDGFVRPRGVHEGDTVTEPKWPGEGCCEYGHTVLAKGQSLLLDVIAEGLRG